ncbi:CCND1 protein, partial [Hypocryptadius cinnamomeus]|nr:CCND1 protein [Hypocryptadius cinnamomeus]
MEHQLLCCEVETIRRAYLDANLLNDRVLQTMLKAEETCSPSVSYFKCVQKEILPYMRKIVATWMLEVCIFWGLFLASSGTETNQSGSRCPISRPPPPPFPRDRFPGAAHVACPRRRPRALTTLPPFFLFSPSPFPSLFSLQQMELLLVNKLKWNLAAMTPHDFIEHFLTKMPLAEDTKQIIRKHAQTFVALCATDIKFISNPPSMIAAGSVVAAVQGLHLGNTNTFLSYQCLTHFLSQVIKCDPDCLRACQEQIESLLESSLRQAQQHNVSSETKTVEDEADLSCTPTDVRDVNI